MPSGSLNKDLEIWPIIVYICCVLFCLISSTAYHWFYPLNPKISKILHRLDLSAIAFLIFGSVFGLVYYSFYCDTFWRCFWSITQFVSCFSAFAFSMTDWFNQEKYIKFKGIVYAIVGIFAGAPSFHYAYLGYHPELMNWNEPIDTSGIFYSVSGVGVFY